MYDIVSEAAVFLDVVIKTFRCVFSVQIVVPIIAVHLQNANAKFHKVV